MGRKPKEKNVRNYRLKRSGLPPHVYGWVMATIEGYENMKAEYDEMLERSPAPPDGQPRGSNNANSIEESAIRRGDLAKKLKAVEQSLIMIPEEYRSGVWNSLAYKAPYPTQADRTTYWRYKVEFLRGIAKRMNWI